MGMITVLLLQILVITNVYATFNGVESQLFSESEEGGNSDSDSRDDYQTQQPQPTIRINENGDHLQFTAVTPRTLQMEYAIGTKLQIITSSELAKLLVLQDKNRRFHRIPVTFSRFNEGVTYAKRNNHYEIPLSHSGDFCFFKLPSNAMDILLNNKNYCFRVLHSDLLFRTQRVVFIPHAETLPLLTLKMKILQDLHLIPNTHTDTDTDTDTNIDIDKASIRGIASESGKSAVPDSFDHVKPPIPEIVGGASKDSKMPIKISPNSHTDTDTNTDIDKASIQGIASESRKSAVPDSFVNVGDASKDSKPESVGGASKDSKIPPKPESVGGASEKSMKATVGDSSRDSDVASSDSDASEIPPKIDSKSKESPPTLPKPPPLSPVKKPKKRRMIGDVEHTPTVIGINVAFETQGILISEIVSEKLLFLIQHIVDKIMPFLSPNDLIITLPVSKKLKHYERATASERVALVVNNARKKNKKLQQAYELQYSTNEESTFGGRIILETTKPVSDVPIKEIQFVDFMISIASLPSNKHVYGISVKHFLKEKHVCFSIIKFLAYDYLFTIGNKISKCILNSMGVQNVNNLNIYISNDGNKINLNADNAKQDNLIEFELELEGNECCFIKISKKSEYHKIYKDDIVDDKNRQIVVLRANIITVVPSESLLRSKSIQISDIVYYVDTIDAFDKYEFEGGMDFSSHSKIKSLHFLLYSSKEYVSIPNGLWYLCVSWTQTNTGNDFKPVQTAKCSDDLYFTANFLLSSDQINLSNELNKENEYEINKLDTSGFLGLQLVHLQSLLQEIIKIRDELNQQNEDEINIYHNLAVHQLASSSYKQHLKQIEIMYQNLLNKKGDSKIDKQDFENHLKIIQQRLESEQSFEKQYAKIFHKFTKNEINDPLKKREDLMQQITNSHQQIVRLRLSMKQQHEMLDSLQQQIDSIQINAN